MSGQEVTVFTVDAFTNEPFSGNPAAVCLVNHGQELQEKTLQDVASEMNLSETVYIQPTVAGGTLSTVSEFNIRWFTPTNEVPLCGHATLASAAVLFFREGNTNQTVTFHSKSGPLKARRDNEHIILDFPLNPTQSWKKDDVMLIIKEICDPSMITDVEYSATTKKLVLRLQDGFSRDSLEAIRPDTRALQAADVTDTVRGVIVTLKGETNMTSTSGQPYDFVSRYFAPWNGIPEDPVTGSAHTVLADYWRKQLNNTEFHARQCSRRGGDLRVKITGDRVELAGMARVVMAGKLFL